MNSRRVGRAHLIHQVIQACLQRRLAPRCFQIEDVGTQRLDGSVETVHCLDDRGFRLGVIDELGHSLQAEANREEVLDHGVVQVTGDPLAVLDHSHSAQPVLEAGGADCGSGDPAQSLDHDHILVGNPPPLSVRYRLPKVVSPTATGTPRKTHRGVVGWEANRVGMLGDLVKSDRLVEPDHGPQHPVPGGKAADRLGLLWCDALVDELGEDPVLADHSQGCIRGAGGGPRLETSRRRLAPDRFPLPRSPRPRSTRRRNPVRSTAPSALHPTAH